MGLTAAGAALLAVSLTGAVVNLWARDAFPDHWGGPNIGGGMLQLIFYGGVLTGVALAVVGLTKSRRDRRP